MQGFEIIDFSAQQILMKSFASGWIWTFFSVGIGLLLLSVLIFASLIHARREHGFLFFSFALVFFGASFAPMKLGLPNKVWVDQESSSILFSRGKAETALPFSCFESINSYELPDKSRGTRYALSLSGCGGFELILMTSPEVSDTEDAAKKLLLVMDKPVYLSGELYHSGFFHDEEDQDFSSEINLFEESERGESFLYAANRSQKIIFVLSFLLAAAGLMVFGYFVPRIRREKESKARFVMGLLGISVIGLILSASFVFVLFGESEVTLSDGEIFYSERFLGREVSGATMSSTEDFILVMSLAENSGTLFIAGEKSAEGYRDYISGAEGMTPFRQLNLNENSFHLPVMSLAFQSRIALAYTVLNHCSQMQ